MGFIKNIFLGLLVFGFAVGLILFLDEITMVFPFLIDMGVRDRFLGDLSAFHIEGFHHWEFGVLLMLVCGGGLVYTIKKVDD